VDDFKRRLYPEAGGTPGGAAREKVSAELARDMASMAEAGGFLVFGVKEDKSQHTFEVDEMDLPVGLHETVDAVARDRITPPLTVNPVLVPNPAVRTKGFLVVEIPESSESPHMTDYTYWGRSETGRIRLSDDRVERLMLARGRLEDQLAEHMASTADADPARTGDRRETHFYFTAVPTRRWPDMLARYTVGEEAQMRLAGLVHRLAQETRLADRTGRSIAYSRVGGYRRSQRVEGLWMNSWDGAAVEGRGRTVGVDDAGPVRLLAHFNIRQRLAAYKSRLPFGKHIDGDLLSSSDERGKQSCSPPSKPMSCSSMSEVESTSRTGALRLMIRGLSWSKSALRMSRRPRLNRRTVTTHGS
jgi:hypothetical protein